MTLAPSWEDLEEVRRDRAIQDTHQGLLVHLADHVGSPSHANWEALLACAGELDGLEGRIAGFQWTERVGPLAELLMAGDAKTWTTFVVETLNRGAGLFSFGGGERLKALSPFKGKSLVVYRGGYVAGEVGAVFEDALARRETAPNPKGSYLLALGAGHLDLAKADVVMIEN